jgi:hypothetical protein
MQDQPEPMPAQKKGLTAIDGAIALIGILLIVQLWLLTATLETYLAGHHDAALPGALISGLLFGCCAALYFFVNHIDRQLRAPSPTATPPPS